MAIITYPLNGIEYLAEDAETYLCTRTSGVFAADGHFAATATGENRQVSISPGLAWIKNSAYAGKSVLNDGTVILEHDIADGTLSRIDRIVLRFDKSANLSEIAIKKGTPSSTPVPPSIERSELIYELGLYEVSIPAASTVVAQANIKSTILDEMVCGIMRDGVTGIPTVQLQEQAAAVIENIAVQFNQFIGEKNEEFNIWFEQLTEILDENAAANLLNLINQNTADIQGLKDDTEELSNGILGVSNDLQNFKNRTDNPHSVTAEQVGAVAEYCELSEDANAELTAGTNKVLIRRSNTTTVNTPYAQGLTTFQAGIIITYARSSTYATQIYIAAGSYQTWERVLYNGIIKDWREKAYKDDILQLTGGTLTGALTIQEESPSLSLDAGSAGTRGTISNLGTVTAIEIQNVAGNTTNRRQLYITGSSSENFGDLSNALRLRDTVNGSSKTYKVLHTANLTLPAVSTTDEYQKNQLRNIQFGTANTPTNALVNGSVYLQYK